MFYKTASGSYHLSPSRSKRRLACANVAALVATPDSGYKQLLSPYVLSSSYLRGTFEVPSIVGLGVATGHLLIQVIESHYMPLIPGCTVQNPIQAGV